MRPLFILPILCCGLLHASSYAVTASPTTAAAAAAPSSSPSAPDVRPGSGESTRSWLALQASGAQASATPPILSGPVLGKVYERYVNSFAIPIPAEIAKANHP